MPNEEQVAIRLPKDFLDRATALTTKMADDGELRAWRITRMAVLRVALQRGLEVLEREYEGQPTSKGKPAR